MDKLSTCAGASSESGGRSDANTVPPGLLNHLAGSFAIASRLSSSAPQHPASASASASLPACATSPDPDVVPPVSPSLSLRPDPSRATSSKPPPSAREAPTSKSSRWIAASDAPQLVQALPHAVTRRLQPCCELNWPSLLRPASYTAHHIALSCSKLSANHSSPQRPPTPSAIPHQWAIWHRYQSNDTCHRDEQHDIQPNWARMAVPRRRR